jgi:8-oxo-dGTP diphosphatase
VPDTTIVVAAAVVQRGQSYLVTRRLRGTHLEGMWEFPGGKCETGESHDTCLRREILEELGCGAEMTGEPAPLLGQDIRWVNRTELESLDFPPADADLIRLLAG